MAPELARVDQVYRALVLESGMLQTALRGSELDRIILHLSIFLLTKAW